MPFAPQTKYLNGKSKNRLGAIHVKTSYPSKSLRFVPFLHIQIYDDTCLCVKKYIFAKERCQRLPYWLRVRRGQAIFVGILIEMLKIAKFSLDTQQNFLYPSEFIHTKF